MTISRYESVTLPQTSNGRYMAKQYAENMEFTGMTVSIERNPKSITVTGRFTGEMPDKYVTKLRKMDGER